MYIGNTRPRPSRKHVFLRNIFQTVCTIECQQLGGWGTALRSWGKGVMDVRKAVGNHVYENRKRTAEVVGVLSFSLSTTAAARATASQLTHIHGRTAERWLTNNSRVFIEQKRAMQVSCNIDYAYV